MRQMMRRSVSNAALDEAAKQRRASTGNVDVDKCRRIAVEIGEGAPEGTVDSPPSQITLLPKFRLDEIIAGRVLQRGSFGTIREIRSIVSAESASDDDDEDKKLLAESLLLEGSKDVRYAIKSLEVESLDENSLIRGMVDLARETDALSSYSHAHIIKIWAIGSSGKFTPDYFVVIDRLYDNLEERIITKWAKKKSNEATSFVDKGMNWRSGKVDVLMKEKLRCAHDIATALEYLHQHEVVFRNLKPSKCSFNIRGDIVLSDMGLSRDTRNASKVTDETFKLTGNTGSLRFMAPEVALNEPYGYSADIYSFGLTLWQMLMAEVPFDTITGQTTFVNLVVKKGARPKVEESWGGSLADLLKSCWHSDLTKRPTAMQCVSTLSQELNKLVKDKNKPGLSSSLLTEISQDLSDSDESFGAA